MNRADVILCGILIIVSLLALLIPIADGDIVTVKHGKNIIYSGSLFQSKVIEIDGDYYNKIEINNGRVRYAYATCPGHECVNSGWISRGSTACVPASTIVTVSNDSKAKVDEIAG